jgi:hypothetical protein
VDTSGGNDGTKKIRELCHSVDDANEVLKECDMMKGYISSQLATALVTRFYLKRALDTAIAVRCVFPSIRPDELCTPCTCHMLTYVCLVFCRVQYAHKHKHAKGGRPTKEVTNQKLRLEKALEKAQAEYDEACSGISVATVMERGTTQLLAAAASHHRDHAHPSQAQRSTPVVQAMVQVADSDDEDDGDDGWADDSDASTDTTDPVAAPVAVVAGTAASTAANNATTTSDAPAPAVARKRLHQITKLDQLRIKNAIDAVRDGAKQIEFLPDVASMSAMAPTNVGRLDGFRAGVIVVFCPHIQWANVGVPSQVRAMALCLRLTHICVLSCGC